MSDVSDTGASTRLQVRVSREQKALFERAAQRVNRPLASWVRDRLEFAAEDELSSQYETPESGDE